MGRSSTIISLLASHQQFIPSVEKALQYNGVNLCFSRLVCAASLGFPQLRPLQELVTVGVVRVRCGD